MDICRASDEIHVLCLSSSVTLSSAACGRVSNTCVPPPLLFLVDTKKGRFKEAKKQTKKKMQLDWRLTSVIVANGAQVLVVSLRRIITSQIRGTILPCFGEFSFCCGCCHKVCTFVSFTLCVCLRVRPHFPSPRSSCPPNSIIS